jgi:erythronate-4-phosphate dehydrogenase
LHGKSIGIVGVGNVGSKVAAFAEALGMKVLLNDPPLQRDGNLNFFVGLDEILKCDIITLHTPLNIEGIDNTYHLFNKSNLDKLKEGTIVINSSRGAVVNNLDLLSAIDKKNLKVVLDVWENEPEINVELLNKVLIGTPHIAGYSYEGKINGTKIMYESLCEFLGKEKTFPFNSSAPQNSTKFFNNIETLEVELDKLVSSIYSIKEDDQRMRKMQMMNQPEINLEFDLQRKNYPVRREFCNYSVHLNQITEKIHEILTGLRFNVS